MSDTGKVSLSSANRRSISDPNRPPDLILPPYQLDSKFLFDMSQTKPAPQGRQEPNQLSNTVQTIYKGRRADQITFDIGGAVRLGGNAEYAFPINSREQGELIAFTVSTNSPDIVTQCFVYDKRDRATVIANHTTTQLTLLGRGMTYQEAHTVDSLGYSVGKHGTPHPVMPYCAYHKHTFTKPRSLDDTDYELVEGTVEDRYFVTDYAPTLPRAYERIYFNVINKGANTRLIHAMTLNRFVYVDEFETVVAPAQLQQLPVIDPVTGQPTSPVAQPPVQARRARVRRG
jgi:hypothetical protein